MSHQFIKLEYSEPHYSTKLWRALYHYCAHFYTKNLFEQICEELQMPMEYLLADDNWVSDQFLSDFGARLKQLTSDPYIFKNIGAFTIDKENINPIEYALIAIMPPFLFFKASTISYAKVNQINDIWVERAWPGHFVVNTKPRGKIKPNLDVCQNTIGCFEGAKQCYDLDFLFIKETTCIHRGDEKCTFEIRYSAKKYWFKRILLTMGVPVATFCIGLGLLKFGDSHPELTLRLLLGFFIAAFFGFVVYYRRFVGLVQYNRYYYEQSRQKQLSLQESRQKLDRRYREAHLVSSLSMGLIASISPSNVVKSCLEELEKNFGYQRAMVMLLSADKSRLYTADVRGFSHQSDAIFKLAFQYPGDAEKPQIFANILSQGKPILVKDIDRYKQTLKDQNRALLDELQVSALLICPLQDNKEKYGLIVIGSVGNERRLTDEDLFLVQEISRLFSISFQNAQNYQREQMLRTTFQKYVPKAVVESLDTLGQKSSGGIKPQTAHLTSMFIDLRGFTTMSEKLNPERVMDILNLYITFVSKQIAQCGGVVDNLIGDGMVIFFPESEGSLSHMERATLAATQILGRLDEFTSQFEARGYPAPGIGIGLHSGIATVGNLGSDIKMNYTAVGDSINLAARLQDVTKRYRDVTPSSSRGCAVLSESTMMGLREGHLFKKAVGGFIDLGESAIRGRRKSEHIYLFDHQFAKEHLEEFLRALNKTSLEADRTEAA